ncbi:MAG: polyprenyl synthetase family protein [Epsilonproteobacteria bacterium]|nr:polyprenyl synthetase family protein [Campylobacterota bacterium]
MNFEEYLQNNPIEVDTFHPFYQEALNYTLKGKAKRFRPQLLLSVVEAKNPLLLPSAMPIALALEMFHTYSLIHDDLPLMDDASLRRGRETLHKKYDELTAVLVGDALNTHAFYLISTAPLSSDVKVSLITLLSQAGGVEGMVNGQIIDCYFEKKQLSLEELKQLHLNKTAKLIAAALEMGGVIVNLPKQELEKLKDFGLKLGLLFQIQDDIIDEVWSDTKALKTTQADENKNSFVKLLGIEKAKESANSLAKELELELQHLDPQISQALQTLLKKYFYRHKGQ